MKKISFLLIATLLLGYYRPLFAVNASTIQYLKSQSADAWITMALVAAGEDISTDNLATISSTSVTSVAKLVLARTAADVDFPEQSNQDLIQRLHNAYANGQLGDASLVNDDFWGLLALASVGDTFKRQEIADFILSAQNSNGGWSYAVGAESDTNDTAAALMALVEAGYDASGSEISTALTYLQSAQNSDGGFGYQPQQNSDGASTAWVMSALNKLDIASGDWSQGANSPSTFLQGLLQGDGSYLWLLDDESGSVLVTAYAVVALTGKSYPVRYAEVVDVPALQHLWVEGPEGTICDVDVAGVTVRDQLHNGAAICGFEIAEETTSFGPYIRSINGYEPSGTIGWLYRVNWLSPAAGADQYVLDQSDEVMWYFSDYRDLPVRLTATDDTIDQGQPAILRAEYFEGDSWHVLAHAQIRQGEALVEADEAGYFTMSNLSDGVYLFRTLAQTGYLVSNSVRLTVGDTASENLDLVVDIIPTVGGHDGDDTISFKLSDTQLDFGELRRGETGSGAITITNQGGGIINMNATVSGDQLFVDHIDLNGNSWRQFNHNITPGDKHDAAISLPVPTDYTSSGIKQGKMIFWARAH